MKKLKYIFIGHQLLFFGFLSIVGSLIYLNTIHGPFIFDDGLNIVENIYVQPKEINWKSINQIFECHKSLNLEPRPISFISFYINYYFDQLNPIGYHLVNILIHIISSFFLFILLKDTLSISGSIYNGKTILLPTYESSNNMIWVSFFTALLWLTHPLNTQSVSYIVQRMNSMGAMFYLLSLICFIKGRNNQISNTINLNKKAIGSGAFTFFWFFGSMISGICALGCKQNTATLPIFIFLYEWFFFQNLKKILTLKLLSWVLFSFIIICISLMIFRWNHLVYWIFSSYRYGFTLEQRLFTEFRVVVYYLSLIIYPNPSRLNLDYDYPLSNSLINPPTTVVAIFTIMILFAAALYLSKKERLISFGIIWLFGNLLIESSFIGIEIIYEHRLYLPSMFIILIFVLTICRYIKFQWMAYLIISAIIIIFSCWTYQRNRVWSDDVFLWSDVKIKSPNIARPYSNLGVAMSNLKKIEEAIHLYDNALRIEPDDVKTHNNLANDLDKEGRTDEAINHYLQAIRINPNYADAYFNLGNALHKKGRTDEAINLYLQAIRINPNFAKAHNNLANGLDKQGHTDEAINHYLQAVRINPDFAEAHFYLGNALCKQGRTDEAIAHYLQAIRIKSDFAEVHLNLANEFGKQGRTNEAIHHYTQALRIKPDCAECYFNLGNALNKQGYMDAAIQHYLQALKIKPDFAEVYNSLGVAYMIKGNMERAILNFKEALQLEPNYATAKNNLNTALTKFTLHDPNKESK
jgi:protein O-mannosyl-transferase